MFFYTTCAAMGQDEKHNYIYTHLILLFLCFFLIHLDECVGLENLWRTYLHVSVCVHIVEELTRNSSRIKYFALVTRGSSPSSGVAKNRKGLTGHAKCILGI